MSDPVESIIAEHLAKKWQGTSNQQAERLLAEDPPAEATRLILASLGRIVKGTTFLNFAVSFIPVDDLPRVADAAVARLRQDRADENAADIISYVSLQSPSSLHPHLDELFDLAPNRDSYYGPYPWRESGMIGFDKLRAVVTDPATDVKTHSFAWSALMETRTPQAFELALASYDAKRPAFCPDLDYHFPWVGYVRRRDGAIRRITPPRVMHLRFPDDYFKRSSSTPPHATHPTWRLDAPAVIPAARFGGESPGGACNCCGATLHHLLTLDPAPADLGVTSVPKISLATCLSCLGWEGFPAMFYEHDASSGAARDITETERREPQFPSGPLLETTLAIVDTPRRWHWQDWGMSNSRENLFRIGGEPCWVQQPEVPDCPRCRETMNYLMQLDGELPTATRDWFGWGSGGLAYAFWCDACRVSAWLWQCT